MNGCGHPVNPEKARLVFCKVCLWAGDTNDMKREYRKEDCFCPQCGLEGTVRIFYTEEEVKRANDMVNSWKKEKEQL